MTIELPANFYLGKKYDLQNNKLLDEPLNYSARDLTTHAVIIGMTGSGETGLGITLLEEAALDGIPALIIDPKGDLTNLLLTFPQLRPDDFLPWVEPAAERVNAEEDPIASSSARIPPNPATMAEGQSAVAEATATANRWREGLAQWGIDGARIQQLRDAADFTIFTPGSESGVPVNILDALRVPPGGWDDDAEDLREKIQGIVSAVLGLIGMEADPLRSREHILLSHLIELSWRNGQDMDVAALILGIQDPPIRKLGVFDLDTFFPPKDRFELAMALNSILAAPSFEPWLKGQALDVEALLRSATGAPVRAGRYGGRPATDDSRWAVEGNAHQLVNSTRSTQHASKPRHAIFYIAHLSDSERMFFVSLLLQQVRSWMRSQPGTSNLRAVLYFDEVFGYLPPYPHNPASKTPLLFLLKNARAYGLGLVLATQNPIDLDYKALTNAGTWFIGKLQTQYDKARLLDGLQTVANESGAALDRDQLNDAIGALKPRVFLYHNVHTPPPIGFESRWAMSYLKGPLTKPQVRALMRRGTEDGRRMTDDGSETRNLAYPSVHEPGSAAPVGSATSNRGKRAIISPDIAQYFLPPAKVIDQQPALPATAPLSTATNLTDSSTRLPVSSSTGYELSSAEPPRLDGDFRRPSPVLCPYILAIATVTFDDRRTATRHSISEARLLASSANGAPLDWAASETLAVEARDLQVVPPADAEYAELPAGFTDPQKLNALQRSFMQAIYREAALAVRRNRTLKIVENPGESEGAFRQRVAEAARAGLDAEQQKIKAKYAKQLERLADKLEKEQNNLSAEQKELEGRKHEELWTNIESVAAFLGIGRVYRPLSTASRRRRQTEVTQETIQQSQDTIEDLKQKLTALRKDMDADLAASKAKWVAAQDDIEEVKIMARKSDIHVDAFGIAWRA
jgi:hypothetical protein